MVFGLVMFDYMEEIEKVVKKGEDFDYFVVDMKGVLMIFIEQMQDMGKVLDQMGVVIDLVVVKYISLFDVVLLVVKIFVGFGVCILIQYGIYFDGVGDKIGQLECVFEQLLKCFDGQVKLLVSNFGFQVDIVKMKLIDWVEEVVGLVGIVMMILGLIMMMVGFVIDFYCGWQEVVVVVILVVLVVVDIVVVFEIGLIGVMVVFDIVMDVNLIGFVVGGIIVLGVVIGGVVLLDGMRKVMKVIIDYLNVLSILNGFFDENVEKVVLKVLFDDGMLKVVQKLGIFIFLVV